jgi:hypothetical protein
MIDMKKQQKLSQQLTKEQLEYDLQDWVQVAGEQKLRLHSQTRPLTIDNYNSINRG